MGPAIEPPSAHPPPSSPTASGPAQTLRVADLVARAGADTELLFGAAQIDRRIVLAPDLPLVTGHGDFIAEILVGLIASAIRFSDAGRVTIGADRFGERVELWVADEGVDLTIEEKVRSLEATAGERVWSTWRRRLRAQGADIWLDGRGARSGTTVRLSLPTAAPDHR